MISSCDTSSRALRRYFSNPEFLHRRPTRAHPRMCNTFGGGRAESYSMTRFRRVRDRRESVDPSVVAPPATGGRPHAGHRRRLSDPLSPPLREIAHDCSGRDRRGPPYPPRTTGIDRGDAPCVTPVRAHRSFDLQSDVRFLRPADTADPQDLGRDEPGSIGSATRRVDQVRWAARRDVSAPARGPQQGREQPGEEASSGPGSLS